MYILKFIFYIKCNVEFLFVLQNLEFRIYLKFNFSFINIFSENILKNYEAMEAQKTKFLVTVESKFFICFIYFLKNIKLKKLHKKVLFILV